MLPADLTIVPVVAPLRAWHADGHGAMAYVRIEGEAAEAIAAHALVRRLETARRRGFGSVRVDVALGASRWSTSVFPQKGGDWFLPVKKAVCRAEGLTRGDPVEVALELL